jgi:ATP-dependent helicase/nuclease subunit A
VRSEYFRQLAAYRSVLGQIYPDREVRVALLWTAVPRLMAIDAALLEQS